MKDKNTLIKLPIILFFFFCMVAFGLGFVLNNIMKISESIPSHLTGTQEKQIEPLYYRTIGNAPSLEIKDHEDLDNQQILFTLELATVNAQRRAINKIRELEKSGIKAYYTPLQNGKGVIFRVRMGVFKTLAQAQKEKSYLKKKNINSRVIKLQ